jgi:hypothetical protein
MKNSLIHHSLIHMHKEREKFCTCYHFLFLSLSYSFDFHILWIKEALRFSNCWLSLDLNILYMLDTCIITVVNFIHILWITSSDVKTHGALGTKELHQPNNKGLMNHYFLLIFCVGRPRQGEIQQYREVIKSNKGNYLSYSLSFWTKKWAINSKGKKTKSSHTLRNLEFSFSGFK